MAGRRLAVAVVQGGPSSEAEVSRASAAAVAKALVEAGHSVVRFELDAFLAESLRTGGFDVVFPVVHGAVGEDGSLQGLLEVLDQPYVGSGVVASALAMHKRIARVLFAAAGLPVAKGVALARTEFGGDAIAAARRARESVGARVVVKPSSHGSAIGVARIDDAASEHDVASAIDAVWAIDDFALAEHFVRGREVTCGVMDLGETRALPVTEITAPGDAFYTFDARYAPGRSVHQCPAKLPPDVAAQVQDVAVRAHRALGCRDLSRVDFVVGDDAAPGALTLLEVNTLPGMTPTSLYPEAAAASGTSMVQLCDAMVLHAHARGPSTRVDARPLPH
jgi:D-alanine-D-alanine ligase